MPEITPRKKPLGITQLEKIPKPSTKHEVGTGPLPGMTKIESEYWWKKLAQLKTKKTEEEKK